MSLEVAGALRNPIHTKEHLQATSVPIDQILRFSTSLVNVSASISS